MRAEADKGEMKEQESWWFGDGTIWGKGPKEDEEDEEALGRPLSSWRRSRGWTFEVQHGRTGPAPTGQQAEAKWTSRWPWASRTRRL